MEFIMNRTEFEQQFLQKSRQVPLDILKEMLDFMDFMANRSKDATDNQNNAWKDDFKSISQWDITEQEVSMKSWKIESF